MSRQKQQRNVAKACNLRANMSLPEVLLWRELKRQSEVKIRRQYGIGRYVLDFYCSNARVCIEVDGIAHDMGDRPKRDAVRDAWLSEQAIEVLPVPATEVLASPGMVADAVVRYCRR